MTRLLCVGLLVSFLLLPGFQAHALKRVAVLYFEDHSGFDNPSGCMGIPLIPFKFLTGKGKGHVHWDLATGFRDLAIEALNQSPYYEAVSFDELVVAMAEEDVTFKDLSRSAEKRARLADKLKADALLIGDLRKFNQERLRGNASRNILYRGAQATTLTGGVEAVGYHYRATVEFDLKIYDPLGTQLSLSRIKGSETYQLGGVNVAPFSAVASNRGTEVTLGSARLTRQIERPIVNYKRLNRIQFGSEEYRRTLLGLATAKAMDQFIRTLQDRIGPLPGSVPESEMPEGVSGKIAYVKGTEAYINLGAAHGLKVGQRLKIFTRTSVVDPDTGDVLGMVNEEIGEAEVVEVKTDRFSRIRILKGEGKVSKGDLVQVVPEKKKEP